MEGGWPVGLALPAHALIEPLVIASCHPVLDLSSADTNLIVAWLGITVGT